MITLPDNLTILTTYDTIAGRAELLSQVAAEDTSDLAKIIIVNFDGDTALRLIEEDCPFPHTVFSVEFAYVGLGFDDYAGVRSSRYSALMGQLDGLLDLLSEEVLILAGPDPEALIVLKALQNSEMRGRIHLWAVKPMSIMGTRRREAYDDLLSDLQGVKSFALSEMDQWLQEIEGRGITLSEALAYIWKRIATELPYVINGISDIRKSTYLYFYDHARHQYLEVKSAMPPVARRKHKNKLQLRTMGKASTTTRMPEDDISICLPREDGKKLCEELRQMRIDFAEANDIPFVPEHCDHNGPCAGTCPQCDAELRYLNEQIEEKKSSRGKKEIQFPEHKLKTMPPAAKKRERLNKKILMGYIPINSCKNSDQVPKIPEFLKRSASKEESK